MPAKPSLRMRSWGTRFDTLPTSPEVSPPSPQVYLQDSAHTEENERPVLNSSPKMKEEKMPHDASVFVGSLPSNVDQQELTCLLSEHLSEHTEVKNIKVVRDSKGGVCAFVQCEDAASAASLIYTLHSNPPKPFLGRTLRYEPARAFRTLLISYRIPIQSNPIKSSQADLSMSQKQSQAKELPLPFAMRIWRARNSKFYSLFYNGEAIDAENLRDNSGVLPERPSLFLRPLAFDAETIRSIAAYFGPLETFNPAHLRNLTSGSELESSGDRWKLYPAPHDAPRSPRMNSGCWEVKWEHRDDCVSALMTLRRVPHLTVTWAHQVHPFGVEHRYPYSPFFQSNVAHYPLHVQNPPTSTQFYAPSSVSSLDLPRISGEVSVGTSTSQSNASGAVTADRDLDIGDHAKARTPISSRRSPVDVPLVRWSDMDFPPLGDVSGSLKTGFGAWTRKKEPNTGRGRSASLTFPQRGKNTTYFEPRIDLDNKDHGQEVEMPSTPGLGRSPITPKTPESTFPATPTTVGTSVTSSPFNESEGKDGGCSQLIDTERNVDPTTLFVGGLETFGPSAWDEEKVFKFFARFGGLESVKIVRPLNSQVSFAFVKFNNTESPARAVFEEHNRVYHGRVMRVQLRDCNPPRGSWKYNKGRNKFSQSQCGSPRHHYDQPGKPSEISAPRRSDHQTEEQHDSETIVSRGRPIEGRDTEEEPEPPVYTETATTKLADTANDVTPTNDSSGESSASSPGPAYTDLAVPTSEIYREWYDEPPSTVADAPFPAATTPTPSTALQYPTTGGYFAPAPWLHSYGHPIPYPMPYMGYPGYPLPNQVHIPTPLSRSSGSEANVAPPSSGTWPPVGMYGPYVSYQAPPARSSVLEGASLQQLNNRAPLAPTGFIQNEQGTLIAVYHPEALGQYMAGATPAASQGWPQYPQAGYALPGPLPAAVVPPASVTWVQNQGPRQPQQQNSTSHSSQVTHSAPYRGGFGNGGSTTPFSFRRQPGRREQNHLQNNLGRNNQFRSFPNRNSRGNMNNAGLHAHGDAHNSVRDTPTLTQNQNDWNQRGNIGGR